MGRPGLVAVTIACKVTRFALDGLNIDLILAVAGPPHSVEEARGERARHLEQRFVGGNADRTDLAAADVAPSAQQRENPTGVGVLAAADVEAKPCALLEAGPDPAGWAPSRVSRRPCGPPHVCCLPMMSASTPTTGSRQAGRAPEAPDAAGKLALLAFCVATVLLVAGATTTVW